MAGPQPGRASLTQPLDGQPSTQMRQKSIRVASAVSTAAASSSPGSTRGLLKHQSSRARCSSDALKAARQRHGTGTCSFEWAFLDRARKICGSPPSVLDVWIRCGLTGACCSKFSCTGKHEPCRTMVTHTLSLSLRANRLSRALEPGRGEGGVLKGCPSTLHICVLGDLKGP